MSRILNYTKKGLVTLQTGEKLQQVAGCQVKKQVGYINSWRSGIKGLGEPGENEPLRVKPYCCCVVLLNSVKYLIT